MCTEALTLVPWSPALSCVSSSNQAGPLVFTGIDGQPGGRLVLGLQAPGQYLSASSSAPRVLKLRPFLMPWSPALSCVRFSTQVGPLALISIDGETRRRIASHLLFLGQWPAAGCPAPGALKLRPFLLPWSPALILGAASWDQAKERAPCGSRLAVWPALCLGDGEPRGRLALGPMSLGLCPSAMCPAPGALKLRSFLAPWCPALSCVSSSAQVGPLALTGIDGSHGRHLL
ncbi:uncharacterized protein LOC128932491 isoform X2 [Callithrix jacchus]|uniref:uncharacterized protein LOC128932491 isoform X2 n=1 Tax=Callithrix jacchus TaxID=9483 RepID=UPI0023DD0847|nr:uncharacterized protein LOC128932491 isoform X2 [Callithrix jacchus]XP_054114198.1 uncharacterized protein LOC128932491 isoform X2 [Callithrix jacchus]XP_054114199.1 uncharacterized protein LOC128932491 isoform X2 [Callithrix jacchus]XP_054114200.1 uncharacterized protein LOC128932491 isoform X2 [Callithrix jacchus]